MANNYFQFKAFTIYQDCCAMKVTTDACLFGAISATSLIQKEHRFVLDIGSGTGLLSLMVAQQHPGLLIDAVEINEAAAAQCRQNIANSKFATAINVHTANICDYRAGHSYDFVITNPPFFENDLKSDSADRNSALHSTALTLSNLMEQVDRLLKPGGAFSILLPYHRTGYFIQVAAAKNWKPVSRTDVKQTEKHAIFRSVLCFQQTSITAPICRELIIKRQGAYTIEFTQLLADYYLHL